MQRTTKKSEIKRNWHLVDAKDKVLGRLATEITPFLLGKYKPYFVKNLDCGDFVVVVNARHIKFTGRKMQQKTYSSYSGYPGGMKLKSLAELLEKSPERVIKNAVSGMLPDNKLKELWLRKLYIFPEEAHKFADKFMDKTEDKSEKKARKKPAKPAETKGKK